MSSNFSKIEEIFEQHLNLLPRVKDHCLEDTLQISKLIANSLNNDATLFFCGNGGSAADSQHLAAEFIGRFNKVRKPLKAISLTTDTSVLTCISNDFNYNHIFSRQIEGLAKPADVLLVFSTSGESSNILNALKVANKLKMHTISFLGKGGGKAKDLSKKFILIPSNSTARIQEMHIFLGHMICELVEFELGLS